MGSHDTDANTEPRIIPALQNINVISVVLGDYNFGALTSTGKLLTWGGYSRGALGLGDPTTIEPGLPGGYRTEQQRQLALQRGGGIPPLVTEPTEVRFDHGEKRSRKRFCFAATSAGWHMGALVIDLEVRASPSSQRRFLKLPCLSSRMTQMMKMQFRCQEDSLLLPDLQVHISAPLVRGAYPGRQYFVLVLLAEAVCVGDLMRRWCCRKNLPLFVGRV